jgi:hypothetical protein
MAYFSKGSELMLLALYPPVSLLAAGWRPWRTRWPWLGLATALLCLVPWLASTARHYGHPLHSTQNFVSGYYGFIDWERGTYTPYWGVEVPGLRDRFAAHGDEYWPFTRENRERMTRKVVLGPSVEESEWANLGSLGITLHAWLEGRSPGGRESRRLRARDPEPIAEWDEPRTTLTGIAGVLTALVVLAGTPVVWAVKAAYRSGLRQAGLTPPDSQAIGADAGPGPHRQVRPRADRQPREQQAGLWGPTAAVVLVGLAHWAFVVHFWYAQARFGFMVLPILAVLGLTGVSRLIEAPRLLLPRNGWPGRAEPWRPLATVALSLAALLIIGPSGEVIRQHHDRTVSMKGHPYRHESIYPRLGRWLAVHAPEAVVMTRNPWELHFYCPDSLRAVNMPFTRPPTLFAIARHYHVTHYLDDRGRPGMRQYLHRSDLLERIRDAPGRLYRINWPAVEREFAPFTLPDGTVVD